MAAVPISILPELQSLCLKCFLLPHLFIAPLWPVPSIPAFSLPFDSHFSDSNSGLVTQYLSYCNVLLIYFSATFSLEYFAWSIFLKYYFLQITPRIQNLHYLPPWLILAFKAFGNLARIHSSQTHLSLLRTNWSVRDLWNGDCLTPFCSLCCSLFEMLSSSSSVQCKSYQAYKLRSRSAAQASWRVL